MLVLSYTKLYNMRSVILMPMRDRDIRIAFTLNWIAVRRQINPMSRFDSTGYR